MSKFNFEERRRLQGFFSFLLKIHLQEMKKKLEENSQGFWSNGPWDCRRCLAMVDVAWYDSHGAICLACKKTLLYD